MEAVRGNLKMLEEAATGFEEEQQPAAGVVLPPERGHVKGNAFFHCLLYSRSQGSSVNPGVFCDVALVMKSRAVLVPPLSRLPAHPGTQRPPLSCGYPSVAMACGPPKMAQAK